MPDTQPAQPVRREAVLVVETSAAGAGARGYLDFGELYAEHFPFVWRCLKSLGVPVSALDDAAQDVFVTVHRRLRSFRGESAFRSWLYGIVRNVAANQKRSVRRKGGHEPLDDETSSAEPDPQQHAQERQAAEFVTQFLERLDEKKREVFLLVALEGLTVPEAAAALSIPLNTAYTRLRNARIEFQRALSRHGGPHDRR